MVDRPRSYVSAGGHGDGDRMRCRPSSEGSTTMAASDVMDAWVAVAGFGQPNDGIPNRLRGTSIPGLILWNGNVRTFQMPFPDLASLAEIDESLSYCTFELLLDEEDKSDERCRFLIDVFSSNVTFVVITFSVDPSAHVTSSVARLAAATPCSP